MKELRLGFLAGWQLCITLTSQRPPSECLCLIASNRTSNLHHAWNLSFFLTHFSSPSFLYSSILMKSPSISFFLMYFNSLALNMWLFLLTWYHIYTICNLTIYTYDLLVQFSSVTQSCPTLCDNMNRSMPGLPIYHQLLEFTQIHVHRVGDAIQPSHPLSSPSPPAPNPSQHQGLFQWVNYSHEVAKELEFQLQHQSFQWTPRTNLL